MEVFTVNLDGKKSHCTAITKFPQKKKTKHCLNYTKFACQNAGNGVSDLKIPRGSMPPDPPIKLGPYGARGAAGVDGRKISAG